MTVINGGASADNLSGSYGDDTIYGGGGNDYLTEEASGNDALYGGDGDDTIFTSRQGAAGTTLLLDGAPETIPSPSKTTTPPTKYSVAKETTPSWFTLPHPSRSAVALIQLPSRIRRTL